ncbi:MAG TPA: hypothetical protein VJV79_01620 [Polyangiaceae bacterium]|nr:hypothetical protein [Polyangiaceae bacterium]
MKSGLVISCVAAVVSCQAHTLAPSGMNPNGDPKTGDRASSAPSAHSPMHDAPLKPRAPNGVTLVERELISELVCDADVFAISGRMFVVCGKSLMVMDESQTLRSDPTLSQGLELGARSAVLPAVVAITGQWPDAAWAVTADVEGNGNSLQWRFFRWRKDHWVTSSTPPSMGGPARSVVFPWNKDGIAALMPSVFGPTRVLALSASRAAIPALTRAVQSKLEREQYPCEQVMIAPQVWARLAPGDVMVFSGQLCGVPSNGSHSLGARQLGLERLRAGQKQGELMRLPMPSDMPLDMNWILDGAAALSETDVLFAARGTDNQSPPEKKGNVYGYIVHWNGTDWSIEEPPIKTLAALWAHADAYWATDGSGGLWLRRNGRWSVVKWTGADPRDTVAWRHGYVSQVVGQDTGVTWLLHKEPSGSDNISRLYRVRFVEQAE